MEDKCARALWTRKQTEGTLGVEAVVWIRKKGKQYIARVRALGDIQHAFYGVKGANNGP